MQAFLRDDQRGTRCFQNTVLSANLAESFVDDDLDGNGTPERVLQVPDCLVVTTRVGDHWEIAGVLRSSVGRNVEEVRMRVVSRGAQRVIEATTYEGTTRETHRFTWTNRELVQLGQ